MQLISAFIVASLLLLQSAQVQGEENIVETIIADGKFTTLLAALNYTALLPVLESNTTYTVFGPNDDAFKKLPNGVLDELLQPENNQSLSKILEYHVVSSNLTKEDILNMTLPANITMLDGGFATLSKNETELKINTATIIKADTFASNGVIHTIDELILPPLDIVETAITKGTFFTLIKALKAADLFATLKGTGPFTVFAPNDEAFAKLSNETLDDLFKPENKEKLARTLKYHVVNGKLSSSDLTQGRNLDMLDGGSVSISNDGGKIKINDANVILSDVDTVNGYVHVIDSVLFPSSKSGMSLYSAQGLIISLVMTILCVYRSVV